MVVVVVVDAEVDEVRAVVGGLSVHSCPAVSVSSTEQQQFKVRFSGRFHHVMVFQSIQFRSLHFKVQCPGPCRRPPGDTAAWLGPPLALRLTGTNRTAEVRRDSLKVHDASPA